MEVDIDKKESNSQAVKIFHHFFPQKKRRERREIERERERSINIDFEAREQTELEQQ